MALLALDEIIQGSSVPMDSGMEVYDFFEAHGLTNMVMFRFSVCGDGVEIRRLNPTKDTVSLTTLKEYIFKFVLEREADLDDFATYIYMINGILVKHQIDRALVQVDKFIAVWRQVLPAE
jgi:hypothetical protein